MRKNSNRNFHKSPLCKCLLVAACCFIIKCDHTQPMCPHYQLCQEQEENTWGLLLGQKVNTTAHSTLQGSLNIISSACYHYISHHYPNCFQLLSQIAIGVIRFLVGLLDALFLVDTGGGVTSIATGLVTVLTLSLTSTSIMSTATGFLFSQVTFPSASSPVPVFEPS